MEGQTLHQNGQTAYFSQVFKDTTNQATIFQKKYGYFD